VLGVLDVASYDAVVPVAWRTHRQLSGAEVALVVASGGRSLWDAFSRSAEYGAAVDPLDAYTRRVVTDAAEALREEGGESRALFAFERHGGAFADFVALGRRAGLGAPSRLGLLLHPDYGPWLSLRAVVLGRPSRGWEPASGAPPGFDPCRDCPAPCASACPGGAVSAGGFSVGRCAATRTRQPGCAADCAARRACVIGPEHAYLPEALAHHMRHAPST